MKHVIKKSLHESLLAKRERFVPKGVGQFLGPVTVRSAKGSSLITAEGKKLIDFAGGIGTMNVGHCTQEVVDAIKSQAEELIHTCIHVGTYSRYIELCERLVGLFPHGEETKVMLTNTGAESVENAIKIARQATGRPAVLCFSGAFHGRSMMAMTLTSKSTYKVNCGPFSPSIYRLPFPNYFRDGEGLRFDRFVQRALAKVREAFISMVPAEHVAAIIIEPVQGEGGFVPAPFEFLKGLRDICDEFGILLICDEVQSGFCRTGKWAAYEYSEIYPDLSTWAKSMGGGMPIGCVIGKANIMDKARVGTIGGTFGGNPVSCAASLATIDFMAKYDLNQRSLEIGNFIMDTFNSLRLESSIIADVRGLGAMVGIEFCFEGDSKQPASEVVSFIVKRAYDNGVVVMPAGVYGNVLRILSPLIIDKEQLQKGVAVLCDAVKEYEAKFSK